MAKSTTTGSPAEPADNYPAGIPNPETPMSDDFDDNESKGELCHYCAVRGVV